jgi:hypothetical protein
LWRSLAVAAAFCIAGAGIATAFSYGTLYVYGDGKLQGKGYGSFARTGYNEAKLTATLADMLPDGGRTFSDAKGYAPGGLFFGVQSGRRADGGSTFARMADKYGYSGGAMAGYTGYVKVCQDRSWKPDWCSGSVSAPL